MWLMATILDSVSLGTSIIFNPFLKNNLVTQSPRDLEMRARYCGKEGGTGGGGCRRSECRRNLARPNDTGHFTPVSAIVSLVYHVRPWEVQPPAALSCGGPSGCLPLKVRLDTPSGPLTFCMIEAQVGARECSPVPAVSLGHPSARGDGEVEADGRLFTFTG